MCELIVKIYSDHENQIKKRWGWISRYQKDIKNYSEKYVLNFKKKNDTSDTIILNPGYYELYYGCQSENNDIDYSVQIKAIPNASILSESQNNTEKSKTFGKRGSGCIKFDIL